MIPSAATNRPASIACGDAHIHLTHTTHSVCVGGGGRGGGTAHTHTHTHAFPFLSLDAGLWREGNLDVALFRERHVVPARELVLEVPDRLAMAPAQTCFTQYPRPHAHTRRHTHTPLCAQMKTHYGETRPGIRTSKAPCASSASARARSTAGGCGLRGSSSSCKRDSPGRCTGSLFLKVSECDPRGF